MNAIAHADEHYNQTIDYFLSTKPANGYDPLDLIVKLSERGIEYQHCISAVSVLGEMSEAAAQVFVSQHPLFNKYARHTYRTLHTSTDNTIHLSVQDKLALESEMQRQEI